MSHPVPVLDWLLQNCWMSNWRRRGGHCEGLVCSGLGRYSDKDDEDGKPVKKKASLPKKLAVKSKPKPNSLVSSEDEDWIKRNPECERSYSKVSGVIHRSGSLGGIKPRWRRCLGYRQETDHCCQRQ